MKKGWLIAIIILIVLIVGFAVYVTISSNRNATGRAASVNLPYRSTKLTITKTPGVTPLKDNPYGVACRDYCDSEYPLWERCDWNTHRSKMHTYYKGHPNENQIDEFVLIKCQRKIFKMWQTIGSATFLFQYGVPKDVYFNLGDLGLSGISVSISGGGGGGLGGESSIISSYTVYEWVCVWGSCVFMPVTYIQ